MRRAMLTNRPLGGAPFTVGDPAVSAVNWGGTGTISVNMDNPAPRGGVITSVSAYGWTTGSGNAYFATGTLSGSTFTVTAATGPLAFNSGLNTYSVSLSIQAGDVLAIYMPSSGRSVHYTAGAGVIQYLTTSTAPTAGQTYVSMLSSSGRLSLEGTGS